MSDERPSALPAETETRPQNEAPTDAAETITSRPAHGIPGAPLTGFEPEWERTAALVGKLSIDLKEYHRESTATHEAFRRWLADFSRQQTQEWGLVRGSIQSINARLEQGEQRFGRIEQQIDARDTRIDELVDCVSAMNIELQSMREPARLAAARGVLRGLVVMLLEDTDIVRNAVARVCEDYGASVLQARSIEEAETLLDSPTPPPDVVTVDLRLAGGRDAMPFVRQLKAHHAVGVVILTGRISPEQEMEARALGIRVLPKPFSIDSLVDAIKQAAEAR